MKKLLLGIGYGILAVLGLLFLWGWGFGCGMGMGGWGCQVYIRLAFFGWVVGVTLAVFSLFRTKTLWVILAFLLLLSPGAMLFSALAHESMLNVSFSTHVMNTDCEGLGEGKYGTDACYDQAGQCEKIEDDSHRRLCYARYGDKGSKGLTANYARSPIDSIDKCHLLEQEYLIQDCQIYFNAQDGTLEYCTNMPNYKFKCYFEFLKANTDYWKDEYRVLLRCEELSGIQEEFCKYQRAEYFKDRRICEELEDKDLYARCLSNTRVPLTVEEIESCESSGLKEICKEYYSR